MWIAALAAILLAAVRRERTWIVLIGAAMLWLLTEIAFALHGWAPSPRYMFEPVAVLVVLVGAGIGRVLGLGRHRFAVLRWVAVAGVAALVVTLAQPAPDARATRPQRDQTRSDVETPDRAPGQRDRRCRRRAARPRLRQARRPKSGSRASSPGRRTRTSPTSAGIRGRGQAEQADRPVRASLGGLGGPSGQRPARPAGGVRWATDELQLRLSPSRRPAAPPVPGRDARCTARESDSRQHTPAHAADTTITDGHAPIT